MAHIRLGWSGIAIHKDLSRDSKIYHYYTMKNFVKLYKSRQLHLTHIYNWDDPWELPYRFVDVNPVNGGEKQTSAYEDPEYAKFIATYANYGLKNDISIGKNEAAAICFTKNRDCDFMWRSFSNGYGVCVESTVIDLIESVKHNEFDSLFIAPVQYINVEEDPKKIFFSPERQYYPYTTWMGYVKRNNFEHEKEIRMIIKPLFKNKKLGNIIVDLDRYINKIILHPDISDKECDCPWDVHERQRIDGFLTDFPKLHCGVELSRIYKRKIINLTEFTRNDIREISKTQSSYPKECDMVYNIDPETGFKWDKNGLRV